jgi:hypothetical protein
MKRIASFIVHGTPVSVNSSRKKRGPWIQKVQDEAVKHFRVPLDYDDILIKIRFFYTGITRLDSDNILKPICDALNGIAYIDDNQIRRHEVEKSSLMDAYRILRAPKEVAIALTIEENFVWIRLFKMGEEVQNLN